MIKQGYADRRRFLVVVHGVFAATVSAQPPVEPFRIMGPVEAAQRSVAVVSSIGLLSNPTAQAELELASNQIRELEPILKEMAQTARKDFLFHLSDHSSQA